jgi:1,4-dihydroxy-2-naphthoyl-CoA hydrolase
LSGDESGARPAAVDFAAEINADPLDGWVRTMGITITKATEDEVRGEFEVERRHLQRYGIVHGGVYCGVIETLASIGAHLFARSRSQRTVGLENHTSFVRAVRSGRLTAEARPLTRGRSSQLWEGEVRDDQGRLVARGTVRLLCLPEDRELGGPER